MRQHRLYKAVWHWSEDENRLSVICALEKEKNKQQINQLTPSNKLETSNQKHTVFYFSDNIDQNQQMIFRQKYQRVAKPHLPNVVTMQDIKDTVLFLAKGTIPISFIRLFCSTDINFLLRTVILYIQLYLKVWEDLEYRKTSYRKQHLKHPISKERENICKQNLQKLRSTIGQEYALIIAGEGIYKKYHHMNNTLNRSYTDQDVRFYDYLSKFITRTVWVALSRFNYKEIEVEILRLFHFKDVNIENVYIQQGVKHSNLACDENILRGDIVKSASKWHNRSPVISDIFKNQEIPATLTPNESSSMEQVKTRFTGLDAALKLPEELLVRFNLTVGILGQPRESFEPLLTVKHRQESIEEQVLSAINYEEVKPKIKMFSLLHELDAVIDLKNTTDGEETNDIIEEILLFEKIRREESNRSCILWIRRSSRPTLRSSA